MAPSTSAGDSLIVTAVDRLTALLTKSPRLLIAHLFSCRQQINIKITIVPPQWIRLVTSSLPLSSPVNQ